MTQRRKAQPTQVAVRPFLSTRIDQHRDQARARGVDLVLTCRAKRGFFDFRDRRDASLTTSWSTPFVTLPRKAASRSAAVADDDALVIAV